jgi:hypothetical protein
MSEVTWKITEVDEVLGNITVYFTNGIQENSNIFRWTGNRDELVSTLNAAAANFAQAWKQIPQMLSVTKLELLQMTGSSSDYVNQSTIERNTTVETL